jgi:hypothetical protein
MKFSLVLLDLKTLTEVSDRRSAVPRAMQASAEGVTRVIATSSSLKVVVEVLVLAARRTGGATAGPVGATPGPLCAATVVRLLV